MEVQRRRGGVRAGGGFPGPLTTKIPLDALDKRVVPSYPPFMSRPSQRGIDHRTAAKSTAAEPWREERQPSEIAEEVSSYDSGWAGPAPAMSTQVARLVFDGLEELEQQYSNLGRSLEDVGGAKQLARQMLAALPTPSPWSELGPFYSSAKAARLLGGISRQAVADRRNRGTLFGLKTADRAWVYPTFQFDERNTVLEGLSAVLKILRESPIDEWSLASWLSSPMRSLEGRSPIEWLRLGKDRAALRTIAADAARRFSQ